MPQRRTTYFNDRTLALLPDVFGEGNVSNRINSIVDRYHELISRGQMELNKLFGQDELSLVLSIIEPSWNRADRASGLISDLPILVSNKLDAMSRSTPSIAATAQGAKSKIGSLGANLVLALIEMIESEHKAHMEGHQ